jgi:hypothetical protein
MSALLRRMSLLLAQSGHSVNTFVPASQMRSAAYVAAFYIDGAPIARRVMWDQLGADSETACAITQSWISSR